MGVVHIDNICPRIAILMLFCYLIVSSSYLIANSFSYLVSVALNNEKWTFNGILFSEIAGVHDIPGF